MATYEPDPSDHLVRIVAQVLMDKTDVLEPTMLAAEIVDACFPTVETYLVAWMEDEVPVGGEGFYRRRWE